MARRGGRLWRAWVALWVWSLTALLATAAAQPVKKPAAPAKPATAAAAAAAASAARAQRPVGPAAGAAAVLPSGKGWRSGPVPAWVVEPPAAAASMPAAPNAGGRREALVDVQTNHALARPQTFIRLRAVASDAAALGSVSQPQIQFNPAFQTVVIHGVAVLRDGRRIEHLADARIESMRREQNLDQQIIDGTETLLVVVSDVRLGEPVELAYTVEGQNPIFEGRIATGMRLAGPTPIDVLHLRITTPATRELQVRPLAGAAAPERFADGANEVIRVVRQQVAAVQPEQRTPPWVLTYPALDISEYRSWAEVDAWAQRLFALPVPADPAIVARAAAFRDSGLTGAALVSEVLRFVQDEVRYFSVSLGESSHRPKPPQQTLAERLGDCKDKVQLLNALLRELGFDARPALVSTVRNRGLAEMLPGHDGFNHVVTALQLDGRRWMLDATINGQGLALASRGQLPYGSALIVGGSGELVAVPEAPDALNTLEFEQRWDVSQPGKPTALTTVLRAHGLAAERWRGAAAAGGTQRLAEALAGIYARVWPGLEATGTPALQDDRQANVLTLTQTFQHPDFGRYNRGALEADFPAVELLDALQGPPEARRRTPYLIDQPRATDSRVVVTEPYAPTFKAPAPFEVNDRHLRYSSRMDISGSTLSYLRRVERRADQVLPADIDSYRENVLRARGSVASRLRLALFDVAAATPEMEAAEKRLKGTRGWRNDALGGMLARSEFGRIIDTKVLDKAEPGSPLVAHVKASRAQHGNLLGDHAQALADADAALAIKPELEPALEARAVALFGAGQAEDALATFKRLSQGARRPPGTGAWMGSLALYLGRAAEAETLLREVVDNGGGEEREFALIWLYLAAEQQGSGRGKAAIAAHVDDSDAKKFSGALLRYLNGSIDRDALLKQAREKPELERLNLAEANFYIGRQLLAQGQRDDAQRWFARSVETGATPYREVTFARLEIERAKAVARR